MYSIVKHTDGDELAIVFSITEHDDAHVWHYAAAAITSICMHSAARVCFYFFVNQAIPDIEQITLKNIVARYAQRVHIIQINDDHYDAQDDQADCEQIFGQLPCEIRSLILIPKVLSSYKHVVYLSPYVVFNRVAIEDLLTHSNTDAAVSACFEPFPVASELSRALNVEPERIFDCSVLIFQPNKITEDWGLEYIKRSKEHNEPLSVHKFLNQLYCLSVSFLDEGYNYPVTINRQLSYRHPSHYEHKVLRFCGKTMPLDGSFCPAYLWFWRYTLHIPELTKKISSQKNYFLLPAQDTQSITRRKKIEYHFLSEDLIQNAAHKAHTAQKSDSLQLNSVALMMCIHDSSGIYWHWLVSSLTSVFAHSSILLRVYIFHDDSLISQAKQILTELARNFRHHIEFVEIRPSQSLQSKNLGRFGLGSTYRLLAMEILKHEPVVVYLDADTIAHQFDIAQILSSVPESAVMAGVCDQYFNTFEKGIQELKLLGIKPNQYINSGVLVFRPEHMPANLMERFIDFLEAYPSVTHFDQSFLNKEFDRQIALLPQYCNTLIAHLDMSAPLRDYENRILHYVFTHGKPLNGNYLSLSMLPFWRYSAFIPEVGRHFTQEYLEYVVSKDTHAHKVGKVFWQ